MYRNSVNESSKDITRDITDTKTLQHNKYCPYITRLRKRIYISLLRHKIFKCHCGEEVS